MEEPSKHKFCVGQTGPFVLVRYHHRKTSDLYVAVQGHPVKCCQCKAEFPAEQFKEHVMAFYRKSHREVGCA